MGIAHGVHLSTFRSSLLAPYLENFDLIQEALLADIPLWKMPLRHALSEKCHSMKVVECVIFTTVCVRERHFLIKNFLKAARCLLRKHYRRQSVGV